MTAKEKAQELIDCFAISYEKVYGKVVPSMDGRAVQKFHTHNKYDALICINVMIEAINNGNPTEAQFNYWNEVIKEIEKL